MRHSSSRVGGAISRRAFLRRVGAAGLGLGALGPMVASCSGTEEPGPPVVPAHMPDEDLPVPDRDLPVSDRRRPPGPLVPVVPGWMLSLLPIEEISAKWDPEVEVSDWGPDLDRYVTEGVEDRSYWASMRGTFYDVPHETWRWDLYLGLVPFVEMANMVVASVIEPWEPYLPSGLADSWIPSVKDEATYDGRIYSYPFGTSIVSAGWHGRLVEAADLDPDNVPATWDEWILSARQVMDRGAAPFGATFNPNGWLSLAPIAHSIDSDIYTDSGRFDFTHEAVVEALEIMRRLVEVSDPGVLDGPPAEVVTDMTTAEGAPAGHAFAVERAAYYFDHVYASRSMASGWSDPNLLRIGALPSVPGGAGGTVFWSVGAGLFIDGYHKEQAAEYLHHLTRNEELYRVGIGNGGGEIGLLQPYEPVWDQWRADPPPWLASWAFDVKDQLDRSRSIPAFTGGSFQYPNYGSGVAQFHRGRPRWEEYLTGEERDPRRALERAMRAARGAIS